MRLAKDRPEPVVLSMITLGWSCRREWPQRRHYTRAAELSALEPAAPAGYLCQLSQGEPHAECTSPAVSAAAAVRRLPAVSGLRCQARPPRRASAGRTEPGAGAPGTAPLRRIATPRPGSR